MDAKRANPIVNHVPSRTNNAAVLGIPTDIVSNDAEERTRELESLLRVAHAITSILELDELMRIFLEQLRRLVEYDCASLILIDGGELVIQDLVLPHETEFRREHRVRFSAGDDPELWATSADRPPLDTPCVLLPASAEFWQRMRDGKPHLIEDALTNDHDILPISYRKMMGERIHTPAFMRSWMATPLHGRQGTIGYFGTSSATPSKFTSRHVRLAGAVADQATVAIENARLYSQAQQLAIVQERHRLARELHDSVAQALYGVTLGAKAARMSITSDPAAAGESLDYVSALAATGLAEMRALIFDLYPDAIRNDGLIKALERQATVLTTAHGVGVEWLRSDEPEAPVEVKEAVYMVMREAMHNTVKHAKAQNLRLSLEADEQEIRFSVQDDGSGFDPSAPSPGHLGVTSMRERIRRLSGRLRIESAIGQGTLVSGAVPYAAIGPGSRSVPTHQPQIAAP